MLEKPIILPPEIEKYAERDVLNPVSYVDDTIDDNDGGMEPGE